MAFVAVLVTGNAAHCVGVAEQTAQAVALHDIGTAVGEHPFGQLVVIVVMVLFGAPQDIGYLGVAVVIGETPFFAQRSPVAQYFAGGSVMAVFVISGQTRRIGVRHHQVVLIGEAAFDYTVAADNTQQIAAGAVFVAHQCCADLCGCADSGQGIEQRYRQQAQFGRGGIGDIAEVQVEHPSVAVDNVLRQSGQRVVDKALMVTVGIFHRHQRQEAATVAVRIVFRDRQRRETQRHRTV
ncbi:Uncharacterised protein [Neisseria animaloris]|nr:Uncharacterised protein [Neisseria animaloris]